MERTGQLGRRYAKYSVTSLAIMSALLAVNPTEARAEGADESVEDLNVNVEVAVEPAQAETDIDVEAALENGEAVLETEAEIAEQEEVVEEAEEAVNQAEETVDEAATELAAVEAEIDEVEQEIDDVEDEAGNTDELEQAIEADEELAADLETEIAETEATQEELETEVAELETEVETIEDTVAAEEETLADLEAERAQLVEESDVAPVVENQIVLPDGYIDALRNYSENPMDENNDIVEEVSSPGLESNTYESQAEDQAVVIEDATNLDNETAIELAQYTAALLNPIREAFGNDLLYPNQSAIDMANAIANTYERDQFNAFEEMGHHEAGIEEVAGDFGLNQGQYYENLGITSWDFSTTLDELKARIYDTIVQMLFDDALSNQGHALSLAGETNNGAAGFLGVSFSEVPVQTGRWDAYQTHFITVPDSSAYLLDANTFDTTANYPYETVDNSEAIAELDNQIEAQQTVVANEQNRLADLQETLATSQQNLTDTNNELAALRDELAAVNTRLEESRTRLDELENVDELLAVLEDELADLEAERNTLSAIFNAAQADLEVAQENLVTEQAQLRELQELLAELKQSPYSFEEESTAAIAFETEIVYNPDLLVGTEEVSQEGVDGVRWLLEHVVYLEDELIDRFFAASEVLVEPTPEIIQVGIGAAEIEDIATPNEPEESVAELEERLAELQAEVEALELANAELLAEQEALRALLASLQAELEAEELTIAELEGRLAALEARVAELEAEIEASPETPEESEETEETDEAGDTEAPVEVEDSDSTNIDDEADTATEFESPVVTVEAGTTSEDVEVSQADDLPETGTSSSAPTILVGMASILSGLGLSIRPKTKRK